jgi:DNA processing protein
VVTPYQNGVPPRRFHFVRRNRLIAALVDAVVVVDATLSSGSLYTAKAAAQLGRALAAVPGTVGTDALIAQGAAVVESAADVRDAIAGRGRRPVASVPDAETPTGRVLAALGGDPRDKEQLSLATGLALRDVTRALVGLELEGLAVPLPGQTFVRSTLAREALGG